MEFELLPTITTKTMLKILQILKEEKKAHWKVLTEKTKLSQSTIDEKLKELRKLKLIEASPDINEKSGRPIKPYHLTPYGKAVLEKLEELENLLQGIAKTPDKPIEEIEKEILAKKIKPTYEVEEEFNTV
jgi:DNA-binding MarR family transcriptional regulator